MVKGEQCLAALKNVVVPVGDEILHDDIELAGVGEGKARLFQQFLLSVTAAPPNGARGVDDKLFGLAVALGDLGLSRFKATQSAAVTARGHGGWRRLHLRRPADSPWQR